MRGCVEMALICNTQPQFAPNGHRDALREEEASGGWWKVYLGGEHHIESGSAYFSQAFAEALGLVSDLELHDLGRAGLRLRTMAILLEHALQQYDAAMEFGAQTGLTEHHERKLQEAGLDSGGIRQVLSEAQGRGLLSKDDERTELLTATFDRTGYPGLMSLYTGKVREIHELTVALGSSGESGDDMVWWQELGWKLMTLFTQTLGVGQAIAILNIFTFRLQRSLGPISPSGLASDVVRSN
jgi:hypothetical protein